MENKKIELKDLSVVEIKAHVYDEIGRIEQSKKIIELLNNEIASRQEAPKESIVLEESNEEVEK